MSLILEALKKLERDKQVPDRGGFLVMAARPWPSGDDSGRRLFVASLALAGFGLLGVAGAGAWWWVHRAPVHSAALPAAAAVVPVAPPSRAFAPAVVPVAAVPRTAAAPALAAPKAPVGRTKDDPAAPAPHEAAPASAPAADEPAVAPKATAELRLTAISERDGKRVAILNERTVFEGDSFEGVTVVRIGDNEVELDVNGRRRIIAF